MTVPSTAPPPEPAATDAPSWRGSAGTLVAVLGNPNTGKTTLFNRMCGVRARTANFPGSTVEGRLGTIVLEGERARLIDLPGVYGLDLALPEAKVCRECLDGTLFRERPDAVLIVADATNLTRNLRFVLEAIARGLPAVVALTMTDLATRRGVKIEAAELESRLGVPVVPVCARRSHAARAVRDALPHARPGRTDLPAPADTEATGAWIAATMRAAVSRDPRAEERGHWTRRVDRALTHPVLGLAIFAAVMAGLFWVIFAFAAVPMGIVEWLFAELGGMLEGLLPAGAIRDLVVEGVVAGLAGTLVFLPQICLLFFLISLLEDTGYLARAAFVVDRLLRRFGLPGHAFVPMLSAHACAIPAIMSTKLIPDRRDRLATLLVVPFLSCSARLPVYVLLVGLLFVDRPGLAGLAFFGCYALGAAAALLTALLMRRTILKGRARPMVLELPTYKIPSLRTALITTLDRAWTFLRKAGTVILGISIVLWWLGTYPRSEPPAEAVALHARAAALAETEPAEAAALEARAERVEARGAVARSFVGRIGRTLEPVFEPLGYDWQLTVGVMSSFAAREVFVSTMAVVLSASPDGEDVQDAGVLDRIERARRDDGTPVFTLPTAASLLVFYVLAMQCLPTLAVTAREAGGWRWAGLQFGWMTLLAYLGALLTYQSLTALGVA